MLLLGLAMSVLFVPGYTGASIQTSWVVLSLALPLALWRKVTLTPLHWAVFAWVGLALASLAWTTNVYDAVWGVWGIVLFALAFYLGSSLVSLRRLFFGLGIGASISACFALAQAYGLHWPLTSNSNLNIAGLYFNAMYAGEIFAIVILGCVIYELYWLVPLLVVALVLTGSHSGWIALAIGLALIKVRSFIFLGLSTLAVAVLFTYHFRPSDAERLQTWYAAYSYLSLFGHGPGSFLSVWWQSASGTLIFPEYVHNDFLQLIYEYGIFALVPFTLFGVLLASSRSPDWPILCAFLFMALVSFPLYTPILSFLSACAAGRLSRDWSLLRSRFAKRRLDLVLRSLNPQPELSLVWRKALPLVSRTSH
jgi:hypothetical protein